jgi:hypothetical protein
MNEIFTQITKRTQFQQVDIKTKSVQVVRKKRMRESDRIMKRRTALQKWQKKSY